MTSKITRDSIDPICDICKKEQEEMPFVVMNEYSFVEHKTLICSKKCFLMYNQLKTIAKQIYIGNPQEKTEEAKK